MDSYSLVEKEVEKLQKELDELQKENRELEAYLLIRDFIADGDHQSLADNLRRPGVLDAVSSKVDQLLQELDARFEPKKCVVLALPAASSPLAAPPPRRRKRKASLMAVPPPAAAPETSAPLPPPPPTVPLPPPPAVEQRAADAPMAMGLYDEPRHGSYLYEALDACDVAGDGSGVPTCEELQSLFSSWPGSTNAEP